MYRYLKRFLDFVFTLILVLAASPLMLIIAALIKLTSRGPVIFRQERVGENGKIFVLLKFRTMADNAEKKIPILATAKDPRRTKTGIILRFLYLDELPQLFSIIKGEMSLIGPRPERPFFHQLFCREIPDWGKRLETKPGITGLAQIMSKSSREPKEKIKYDLIYLRDFSFKLDVIIFAKTMIFLFKTVVSAIANRSILLIFAKKNLKEVDGKF